MPLSSQPIQHGAQMLSGIGQLPLIPTLGEIFSADPDEFVTRYTDIGAINLACAVGLPRAENLDISKCLRMLDAMATWVRERTKRSWWRFEQIPEAYYCSPNVFRVAMMIRLLKEQFGIHYDPAQIAADSYNPADSGSQFIHGLLSERRCGTCATLPVFAVAVGRRLGYPLYLVSVPEHLLFRWDDGDESFNVEYNGSDGDVHENDYYRHWPFEWGNMQRNLEQRGIYLTPATRRQEVAKFLGFRTEVLNSVGRSEEIIPCMEAAERFNPLCTDLYRYTRAHAHARLDGYARLEIPPTDTNGRPSQLGPELEQIGISQLYSGLGFSGIPQEWWARSRQENRQ